MEPKNTKGASDNGENGEKTPPTEEDHPIYFDKSGRPLFGTHRPSAFAYGHPWPPTPTNICKKQVLRPPQRATSGCSEPYCPKNCTEIELALYWDRAPKWNFTLPKFVSCPVHGPVNTRASTPSLRPASSINMNKNNTNSIGNHEMKISNHTNSFAIHSPLVRSSSAMNIRNRNHNEDNITDDGSVKFEKLGDRNANLAIMESSLLPEFKNGKNSADYKSKHNSAEFRNGKNSADSKHKNNSVEYNKDKNSVGDHDSTKQSDSRYNKNALESKESSVKNEETIAKCSEISKPAMIVSRNNNRTSANKMVQVSEKDLKAIMSRTTYFCPLHGTYLNGVKRRNTPKFRSVVLKKDTEVQADLMIPTSNRYRECHKSKEIGVVRKSENRITAPNKKLGKKILVRGCSAPSKKEEEVSEYKENYKNPKKVAESKKVK